MNNPCHYRVSVKGLVVDGTGRFLLVREDNGKWDIPGGGLEHDEDPIAGLRREIQEEMGLHVTYISPSPKYFITTPKPGTDVYFANVIYEIKLESFDFTASEECQEIRFFSVSEARQEDYFANVGKLLDVYDPGLHVA